MSLIHHYPPQTEQQRRLFHLNPSQQSYGPLPTSPRAHSSHDSPNRPQPLRHHADQRALPQQYARPLQKHYSHPNNDFTSGEGQIASKPAEHMLRRKTPHGILNEAYDGTSMEHTERPHAMKHILLPVAEPVASDSLQTSRFEHNGMPLRSPYEPLDTGKALSKPHAWPQNETWDSGVNYGYTSSSSALARSQQYIPQIDSMLHQMPPHPPRWSYPQSSQQFGGFFQQPFQPPLGPTSSNAHGPYGPYWPDGTFVSYRPAATRDLRFYSHAIESSGGNFENIDWQGSRPSMHRHDSQHDQMHFPRMPSSAVSAGMLNGSIYPHTGPHLYNQYRMNSQSQRTEPSFASNQGSCGVPSAPTRAYPFQEQSQPVDTSGQSTPRGQPTPATTPLAEYGPQSQNGVQRERIFSWAHAIYTDLVKYLHQTRRNSQHSRHGGHQHQSSRPSIYPKPPRQPTIDASTTRTPTDSEFRQPVFSTAQSHRANGQNGVGQELGPHSHAGLHPQAITPWSQTWAQDHDRRSPWQTQKTYSQNTPGVLIGDRFRTLRRVSGSSVSPLCAPPHQEISQLATASSALESLTELCRESAWKWVDGMLLGGCLAYALCDYQKAMDWYSKILSLDASHVEAMSNMAATLLAVNRKQEAEGYWMQAVRMRPSYFEAVEHLVGLLSSDNRGKVAVNIIDHVERALQYPRRISDTSNPDQVSDCSNSTDRSPCISELSDKPVFDFDGETDAFKDFRDSTSSQPGFGSSGYAIPGSENGRILQLIHAKGNMLYAMGDNVGAAKAFESAVLIGAGRQMKTVDHLIKHILAVVAIENGESMFSGGAQPTNDPILLPPDKALQTARLCFPSQGELPGLKDIVSDGIPKKAAVSTTSNSLLSLAKIFQDGMATNSPKSTAYQTKHGVREILALYYLSLSLQPSPSTANNVGILLASVQHAVPSKQTQDSHNNQIPRIPGVVPGSGIALALAYYNYGLNLDQRHAHLYTNLGSLLKDIGQLSTAIQMYERAVNCDPNFDIALANLANAVKDQGRIADAITYYKRAVNASPDFAEAVCGLANALNSVCSWQGRGGIAADAGKRDRWHVDEKNMLLDATQPGASSSGWIKRVVDLVEKQLGDGENWGKSTTSGAFVESLCRILPTLESNAPQLHDKMHRLKSTLEAWAGQKWEGARLVRIVERFIRRIQWQWYQDKFVKKRQRSVTAYARPYLPSSLTVPAAPTVLPFHTFTCPMSAKQIRLISQRNGLRISCSTLKSAWLPSSVYKPPSPPSPILRVGYVSSDFSNHPLAHLMQSVFGMHNSSRVKAFCYATTVSDNSIHRQQIEREAPVFYDASSWSAEKLVHQILEDGIHILVNLNGYTRGARNEVFAARPAPIQMSFMGFAGTLGAEWCDYLLADDTAVPVNMLRPWRRNVDVQDQLDDDNSGGNADDWVYGENVIFCKDTFFCCDHRQSAPDAQGEQLDWAAEQQRRWNMRKEIFPQLPDDVIILGNFNQLYKIEPTTFRTWLRILQRLPHAILWLLRFPDVGESHLRSTATAWAGPEVASRIMFTDVAPKAQHISRARVCDLFLDTPECNAHTTAADVLWSGTPLLTLPRYGYKMCSRMAASILKGALPRNAAGEQAAKELIVSNEEEYEERAVELGLGLRYEGVKLKGRLGELRKLLYEARWESPLFDTKRWVRDLEEAYQVSWERWVKGEGGDIWLQGYTREGE